MRNSLALLQFGSLTALLAVSAFASAAEARTYYVASNGNDENTGLSPGTAFLHIQNAANVTEPGDTVMVMAGIYQGDPKHITGSALKINRSGTAQRLITFMPYPGNRVIIAALNNKVIYDTIDITASYIVFSGFEVIGHAQYVSLTQANATARVEEQNYLKSLKAHEANPSVPVQYPSDTMTNGACLVVANAAHVTIENNIVHDCSGSGIAAQESDYFKIISNVVFNTSWWTVYDTTGINIHYMMNFDQNSGYKNLILNNISHDSGNTQAYYNPLVGDGVPTDGNGIIVDTNQHTNDGKPYLGRTLLMGNIVYNNGGTGMHTYLSSHVDIFDNTAFNNNTCPVYGSSCGNLSNAEICANISKDVNIYNNILFSPKNRRIYTDYENMDVSEDYNLFYAPGGKILLLNYKLNKHDKVASPGFSDGNAILKSSASPQIDAFDIAHPRDAVQALALSSGSPARNAGTATLDDGAHFNPEAMNGNLDTKLDIGALSFAKNR